MEDQKNQWKLVAEWADLNSQLEKIWEPGFALFNRRNEIEKEISWLKGHGVSPSGPQPSKPPPSKPVPPSSSELLIIGPPKPPVDSKKRKTKTEDKIRNLSVMQSPSKPPSDPIFDQTQSFQGDPNKK